jgi:hypothetical protein
MTMTVWQDQIGGCIVVVIAVLVVNFKVIFLHEVQPAKLNN